MTKFLYILAAVACIASTARSDQPQYFLKADGTVEQRVAKVESDVSKLEARIADLERQLGTVASKSVKAASAPAAPAKVRYSVCTNGRCTVYEVDAGSPVPFGATILSTGPSAGPSAASIGSPCPTGGCGDACGCVGGVVGESRGWYFGKLLGRRR